MEEPLNEKTLNFIEYMNLNNRYPHSRNPEQESHKRTSCFSYARNQKRAQNGT